MKKLICIILSVAVIALAFAGCGNNNKKENNNMTGTSSSQNNTTSNNGTTNGNSNSNVEKNGSNHMDSDDGFVDDKDGIIGNENHRDNDDFSIDIYESTTNTASSER